MLDLPTTSPSPRAPVPGAERPRRAPEEKDEPDEDSDGGDVRDEGGGHRVGDGEEGEGEEDLGRARLALLPLVPPHVIYEPPPEHHAQCGACG